MCTHFTPFTAILIDVLWDTFSIGGLLHLGRCQRLLLYPLMTLSVPSAGVTEYGPSLFQGKPDFLGFLTEGSIIPSFRSLLFIYVMVLFWFKMKCGENLEITKTFGKIKKKNFLVVLELSSQWQQAAEVVSSQRLLWPHKLVTQSLPIILCSFIFIRRHIISWYFLALLFVLIMIVGILSIWLNGTSPVPILAWDIFDPQ